MDDLVKTEPPAGLVSDRPALETALVAFIQDFSLRDVTPELRAAVSMLMRDQLAAQIGSSRLPWSKQVLAFATSRQVPGKSRVTASHQTMSAVDAAFVNATYGHAFEYDDCHRMSSSHPGCCVVPTALAVGEEIGASLDEVICAIIVGYEVYARIGSLAFPELIRSGFHPAAVLANFGATAVVAKLQKFDAETTAHALAIALSHASGPTEYSSTGGSVKRVHPGIGVRGGMLSAGMAKAGITGPLAFMTGIKGFFSTFLKRKAAEDAAEWFEPGREFEIEKIWLKPYCCCGCIHAYADIMNTYAGRLGEIESLSLRIQRQSNVMVGTANANLYTPKNIEHVQFSLPIQMAFSLLGYGNGYPIHNAYMRGEVDMDLVIRTARMFQLVQAPELDDQYPGKLVGEVTVNFRNGKSETTFVADSLGTVENPMSNAAQDTKFMELTSDLLGETRARELLAALHRLDPKLQVEDLTAMTAA